MIKHLAKTAVDKIFALKNSLSGKLLGLFFITAFLLVIVGGANIAFSFKNNFKENVRPHLIQYLEYIQADIGSPPDIEKAKLIASRLPVEVSIISETTNWSSNKNSITPDLSAINYYRDFRKDNLNYKMGEYNNREYLIIMQPSQTLAFSIPHPHEHFKLAHVIPIITILLLLVLFYYSTKRIFQPITSIEAGIKLMGQGNLKHRINVNRDDELGALAKNINGMAEDINNMLEAKRQLLLAISHEIRTPVTRARIATEMLNNEKYKADIIFDLDEIETLTEEILEIERLNTNHTVLNKQNVSPDNLLKEVINAFYSEENIEINTETTNASLDPSRIKLLMKNLIGNAILHNENTITKTKSPLVELKKQNDTIIFSVQDFGKGISNEHIPHLTEPFYRVDPSRKRETGGYGLGLYLCRIIIEAHGGKLQIKSKINEGTEIKVTLPTNHI